MGIDVGWIVEIGIERTATDTINPLLLGGDLMGSELSDNLGINQM
jgi:hypothetical protein